MNCNQCKKKCCQTMDICLTKMEYDHLFSEYKHLTTGKEYEIHDFEYFVHLKPCPFLVNNECAIYEDRPLVCKIYPVYTIQQQDKVLFAFAPDCELVHSVRNLPTTVPMKTITDFMGISNDEINQCVNDLMRLDAINLILMDKMSMHLKRKRRDYIHTVYPNKKTMVRGFFELPFEDYKTIILQNRDKLKKEIREFLKS